MSHESRMAELRLGVIGAALAAVLSLAGVAQASDLYQPYGEPRGPYLPPPVVYGEPGYPPPPAPPIVYGEPRYAPPPVIDRRVVVDNGACRIVHRRHIDPYGREIVRRVRVCEEGEVEPYPRWAERGPRYGYEPYYGAPRPPRAVPQPYDDLD
jgi:hypothetical protein